MALLRCNHNICKPFCKAVFNWTAAAFHNDDVTIHHQKRQHCGRRCRSGNCAFPLEFKLILFRVSSMDRAVQINKHRVVKVANIIVLFCCNKYQKLWMDCRPQLRHEENRLDFRFSINSLDNRTQIHQNIWSYIFRNRLCWHSNRQQAECQ